MKRIPSKSVLVFVIWLGSIGYFTWFSSWESLGLVLVLGAAGLVLEYWEHLRLVKELERDSAVSARCDELEKQLARVESIVSKVAMKEGIRPR